jgi:hypothetical protein
MIANPIFFMFHPLFRSEYNLREPFCQRLLRRDRSPSNRPGLTDARGWSPAPSRVSLTTQRRRSRLDHVPQGAIGRPCIPGREAAHSSGSDTILASEAPAPPIRYLSNIRTRIVARICMEIEPCFMQVNRKITKASEIASGEPSKMSNHPRSLRQVCRSPGRHCPATACENGEVVPFWDCLCAGIVIAGAIRTPSFLLESAIDPLAAGGKHGALAPTRYTCYKKRSREIVMRSKAVTSVAVAPAGVIQT